MAAVSSVSPSQLQPTVYTVPRIMSPSVPPLLSVLEEPFPTMNDESVNEHLTAIIDTAATSDVDNEDDDNDTTCANFTKKPSCCRRLIHQFDKEYTFRPKLNPSSLKIAHERQQRQPPLITRLTEVRNKGQTEHFDKDLTFSPRLNSLSIKLAQDRAKRSQSHPVKIHPPNMYSTEYTFKPVLLGRSIRIAEKLEGGFLDRQQQHVAKRQQLMANNSSTVKFTSPIKITRPKQIQTIASTSSPQSTIQNTVKPERQFLTAISSNKRIHRRSQTAPCIPLSSNNIIKTTTTFELLRQTSDKTHHKSSNHIPGSNNRPNNSQIGLLQLNFKSLSEGDRVKRVKVQAEKVIRAKKLFQIKGGYQTIRKALKSRGWVELNETNSNKTVTNKKLYSMHNNSSNVDDDCGDGDSDGDMSDSDIESEEEEDEEEYLMLCRAVRNSEPHLIWALRRIDVGYHYLKKDQIINHFSGAWFTTKFGLCESLQELPWYGDIDAGTFFPRCYLLNSQEDKSIFEEDYQLTAAFNVLKIVACQSNPILLNNYGSVSSIDKRPNVIISNSSSSCLSCPSNSSILSAQSMSSSRQSLVSNGRKRREPLVVSEELLLLAIREAEYFISQHNHNDLEGSKTQLDYSKLTQEERSRLLSYYYNLTLHHGIMYCSQCNARKAEELLPKLSQFWPQISIDGLRNTWIIKPGAMSRGRGIICKNHLQDILQIINPSIVMRKNCWVVQKYIERPLLIYSTKFDIRQWFLVTDWNPLTMWMYTDCYLRFSSQLYSLEKLDTSIHLCNNSVQKHMINAHERDQRLPLENMWDSIMFQSYLKDIGEKDKWSQMIYPGMKQAIISVLQVAQDRIIDRKNTFELYGADFMIGADFNPWLIEINCSPTMEKSTAITKRLCKQVMEDTIKVVIDRRNNKDCDTGSFELAYKQIKLEIPPYTGIHLSVEGSAIKNSRTPLWRSSRQRIIPTVDLNQTI